MAFKTEPSLSCPEGHARSQVHGQGTKKLKSGTTRQWRCRYVEQDAVKGLRKPAPIELRPAAVQHSYRYQLHRPEPA